MWCGTFGVERCVSCPPTGSPSSAVYLVFVWRTDISDVGHGPSGLLRNLTLTQTYGYGHLHSGLTQMWSLVVEVAFYLMLPVFAVADRSADLPRRMASRAG